MKKGFTLIELLVVIAIIGLLSSVVLASLNAARGKASDAAVKSNLANIRAQAELYYDTNAAAYSTVNLAGVAVVGCSTANSIFDAAAANNVMAGVNSAVANSGNVAICVLGNTVGLKASAWAVAVPLKTNPAQYWCVDSRGASRQIGVTLTQSVCP